MSKAIDTALRLAGGGRATWTSSDPRWAALSPYQKAAAMALLEADAANPADARNALGAMINRAQREKQDLGEHVGRAIYQPAIEPTQQARLDRVLKNPEFANLSAWAERRAQGQEDDPVNGATHFLAPEKTMLALEAREPQKYRSWRQWTNFDPESNAYRGVILRDGSHAFLAPDGKPVQIAAKPDYEGAIDPPSSGMPSAVAAAPSPAPVATAAAPAAEPDNPFMPKAADVSAAQGIAKAVMGFGQPAKLYDVAPLVAQPLGGPGQLAAGMAMADASGLARGLPGRPAADRAVALARADGGAVEMAAEDTGANLPETADSLVEQQKQVLAGRRPATMFPNGTPELPVPSGLERVVTARGVFHYNPALVSASEIVEASAEGRENEVLGLGPMSKADVIQAAQATGEKPVAITERTPFGAEVKASLTVPSAVMTQAPEILANRMPGNSVGIEPVEAVIQDRVRERTGQAGLDRDRSIATALRVANPPGYARGGAPAPAFKPVVPYANPVPYAEGPVVGSSGGRADTVKTAVRGGSHVIPSDVVSSLGQGNTDAGMSVLSRMFKSGPYGMAARGSRRADGGAVPVMVSHGEFVVPPEAVAEIGGGDHDRGHAILDRFILGARQNAIETLKRLPGPAKD